MKMGFGNRYQPCFTSVPESVTDRWSMLRKFVSRWHDLNLPMTRDTALATRDIEKLLNRELPDSMREWIAFSLDLMAINSFENVMRDVFKVIRIERFACITLMIQGEGDVCWTVADENLKLADPPVDCLHLNVETNEWTAGAREFDSLTSFVVGHMAHFLGLGFVLTRGIDESAIAAMDEGFTNKMNFDGLRIYEMIDVIAFVRRRSGMGYQLIVARKATLPESELPKCVLQLMNA